MVTQISLGATVEGCPLDSAHGPQWGEYKIILEDLLTSKLKVPTSNIGF